MRFKRAQEQTLTLEIGSAFTKVMVNHKLVFYEPTLFIWQKKAEKVWLLGEVAEKAQAKLTAEFKLVHPVVRRVPTKKDEFREYLRALVDFLDLKVLHTPWKSFKVRVLTPKEVVPVYLEVFKSSVLSVLHQAEFGLTTDVLSQHPFFSQGRQFGLDLGQTLNLVAFNQKKLAQTKHYLWGEAELNARLERLLLEKFSLQVPPTALTKIKRQLATFSASQTQKASKKLVIKAKDIKTGLGKTVALDQAQLVDVFDAWFKELTFVIDDFFTGLDGTLAASLVDNGLILFGGLTNLNGLDTALSEYLGCEVKKVARPELFLISQLDAYE